MPRVKERSNLSKLALENRYATALKGLEDGTYKSLASAAQANNPSKSSLGHRKNGRQPRQEAHQEQQIFSPAAEKAMVKWILKLDDFGFSPGVDILMGLVKHLAKDDESLAGEGAGGQNHRQELDYTISDPAPYPFYQIRQSHRPSACLCKESSYHQ